MDIRETNSFFEKRIYFDCFSPYISGSETRGLGFRSYSKVVGWALSFFLGLAKEIQIEGKKFYINKKSYFKFLYRISDKTVYDQSDLKAICEKMNDLYRVCGKVGYKYFKMCLIEQTFNRTFSPITDFGVTHFDTYKSLMPNEFYTNKLNVLLQNPLLTKRE